MFPSPHKTQQRSRPLAAHVGDHLSGSLLWGWDRVGITLSRSKSAQSEHGTHLKVGAFGGRAFRQGRWIVRPEGPWRGNGLVYLWWLNCRMLRNRPTEARRVKLRDRTVRLSHTIAQSIKLWREGYGLVDLWRGRRGADSGRWDASASTSRSLR